MSATRWTKGIVVDNASMIYFMLGGLLAIWGGFWFVTALRDSRLDGGLCFVCGGLVAAGIALIGVGFSLGRIAHGSELDEVKFETNEDRVLAAEKSRANLPKL